MCLTIFLHNLEELNNYFRGRSDDDLSLSTLLSVRHSLEAIGKNRHFGHLEHKLKLYLGEIAIF